MSGWRRPFATAVLVVAAAAPAGGEAQDPAEPPAAQAEKTEEKKDEPARFEERVEVTGRLDAIPTVATSWAKMPVRLAEIPASVAVVPRAVFAEQDAVVLGDALTNAAGVNVASGFGVFDFFVIRGFDSLDTGLVLTDGAIEPESTFYPLYNVERVEVLRGPAAFLYGGNPLSGAVNLVRKAPAPDDGLEVELSAGSFRALEAAVDLNEASASRRVAFRLNGYVRDSDQYRDGMDARIAALHPSLTIRLSERSPLTVGVELVSNRFQPDAGLPLVGGRVPDVPRRRSYQSPFDRSEQDIVRLRVDWALEVSPRLTVRSKLYYTDFDWKTDGTLLLGALPAPGGSATILRSLTLLDDRQRLFGNQLEALVRAETGAVLHEILVGVETGRYADRFTLDVAFLPPIDLLRPVELARRPPSPVPQLRRASDARSLVLAPYVLDRMSLAPRVHLYLGGRLDAIDYDDPPTGTSRRATELSPMAGLVVGSRSGLSGYGSLSRSFAPPSSLVVGEREPETSRQLEAGVRKELASGAGRLSLAVYRLVREGIAIAGSDGVLRQTGRQRSRGVELELAVEPLPGWTAAAAYAWNDARLDELTEVLVDPTGATSVVDRSGNRPPFAPRHLLTAWTELGLAEGWRVGLRGRYIGRQFIAPDNAFALDPALVVDAWLARRWERFGLRVNLKNVTDTEYETRGFGAASVLPADPFSVSATLVLRVP